jgi:PTH1 family peptidyl-tRNA hydrolase
VIRLVVGLGNPGPRFSATRHNMGARAVRAWLLAAAPGMRPAKRHHGQWWRVPLPSGDAVSALVPGTYMNESGLAVASARRELRAAPEEILLVYDDMDLPVGRIRLRPAGSSGGHNGVRSVIERLGSDRFPRLRLGVGRPPQGASEEDVVAYVLSPFDPADEVRATQAVARAAEAISLVLQIGVEAAMNRVNGTGPPEPQPA